MTAFAKRAMSARNGDHGYLVWITTVSGDGASMSLIATSRKTHTRVSHTAARVEEAPALILDPRGVDRELDVGRGHGLAVRELDARAQLEGVGLLVGGEGVGGRKPGLDVLAVLGDGVERLHDLLEDPDRLVV